MPTSDLQQELVRAVLTVIVAVITLGLGWLVGQRLAVYWAIRQKRRELELAAVNEFYRLYGEFFAIWKLWAYCKPYSKSPDRRFSSNRRLTFPETTRWTLLERALAAEAALEAIFVKLSSERNLSDSDIEILGRFRQAYQKLRESIRDGKDVGWEYQNHPEYLTFKRLAHLTACIILADSSKNRAAEALTEITSGVWERNWVLTEADWKRLGTVAGKEMSPSSTA